MSVAEPRRLRRTGTRWLARGVAAAGLAAVLLGIPAPAMAVQTRPATAPVAARARSEGAIEQRRTAASRLGERVETAGRAQTVVPTEGATSVHSRARAGNGLVARLSEARRADGVLGQWVVGVLVGIVIVLWVILVAAVVRVHLRLAHSTDRRPARRR